MSNSQHSEFEKAYKSYATSFKKNLQELKDFKRNCKDVKSLKLIELKTKAMDERQQQVARWRTSLEEIQNIPVYGSLEVFNELEKKIEQLTASVQEVIVQAEIDRLSIRKSLSFNDLDPCDICVWCNEHYQHHQKSQTCPSLGPKTQ